MRVSDIEAYAGAADANVAVIGLGYVGLPLALAFHDAGLRVIGYDTDRARVQQLLAHRSPLDDIGASRLAAAFGSGFSVRADYDDLGSADAIFVCVPTPLKDDREPDLGAVIDAGRNIASKLRLGQLVVLQSTTWPGTTAGPFREELERSGLVAGRDFGLAYTPERVSPGDPTTMSPTIPRLVAGLTSGDRERCARLMQRLGGQVHGVSSLEVAELAKLHENVFRNVNIALANQLALLCERINVDAWEVMAAAATKPFGFMPFWPGPGVGGHCIPVDPYYLSWRARASGVQDEFVDLAARVNESMPEHVVDLTRAALADRGISLAGARVGVVGVAFKRNVRDTRNAPARQVIASLVAHGANVTYHDPHVQRFTDAAGVEYVSSTLSGLISGTDAIVVLVAHAAIDWPSLYADASIVVDAVNSSAGIGIAPRKVLRLGAGWS